jgi:hypothetical protein
MPLLRKILHHGLCGEETGTAWLSRGTTMFEKSALAQARLHELVPGGAHTYARGSDQYPEAMTPILVRGHGARVEDLDGNWSVEYGMGLRSIILGHADEPVAAAVGVNFLRPSVWELRTAEDFLARVPRADMVKFAKSGSDTTTTTTGKLVPGFLGSLPAATRQHSTVLIFGEMITGMRWSRHGAQGVYRVRPDTSPWTKAIGNAFAVYPLAGKWALKEAGGPNTDASRCFSHRPPTAPRPPAWQPMSPCLLRTQSGRSRRWRFKAQSCARDLSRSPRRPACRNASPSPASLMSGFCDQRSQRRAVSGFSYLFHSGVAASVDARSILGDFHRPHRG